MAAAACSPGSLADLGLDETRWQRVQQLAESLVADGTLPAIAVQLVREGRCLDRPLAYGRRQLQDAPGTLPDEAIFLVASLTKPVVGMAALLLVERGDIALNDRIVDLLPEFSSAPRRPMTVRHLLTHTSGLPDMLPNNQKLRESNSPLSAFFEGTCAVTLDFSPGHAVQYQSMGFVLLSEIIRRVSGRTCSEFVRDEIFKPLAMRDAALGAPAAWFESPSPLDRLTEVRVPEEQREAVGWNWNSRYWLQFGAPWGGMLASAQDVARFCAAMIDGDLFSPALRAAALSNQLEHFPDIPEADRRTRPWGLGWRLNWISHSSTFGDLLGPHVAGHWGATGTLCWLDTKSRTACVILTTQPLDRVRNHLVRLSNTIVAAL